MNQFTRFAVASCTGLILAFTASPALAAHTDDSNGAHVDRYESPDGTREHHQVTRHHGDDYFVMNSRDQDDIDGTSSDWKQHYIVLENASNLSSQITTITDAGTCRTKSRYVTANGLPRSEGMQSRC